MRLDARISPDKDPLLFGWLEAQFDGLSAGARAHRIRKILEAAMAASVGERANPLVAEPKQQVNGKTMKARPQKEKPASDGREEQRDGEALTMVRDLERSGLDLDLR